MITLMRVNACIEHKVSLENIQTIKTLVKHDVYAGLFPGG